MNGFDVSPLWISIKTAFTATAITFFFGITAGWFVARYNGKAKGIIDGILTLPLVLPPTVMGFILLVIFGKNGFIGRMLYSIGITIIFSWTATVISAAVVSFPLIYRTAKGAFEQLDGNLLNVARTLGASEWKVFWKVAVPLAKPGITAGAVLAFARALGEFGATLMIAGSIQDKTQTIPIAIYFAVQDGDMQTALIWVVLISLISFMVMIFTNRRQRYKSAGAGNTWEELK